MSLEWDHVSICTWICDGQFDHKFCAVTPTCYVGIITVFSRYVCKVNVYWTFHQIICGNHGGCSWQEAPQWRPPRSVFKTFRLKNGNPGFLCNPGLQPEESLKIPLEPKALWTQHIHSVSPGLSSLVYLKLKENINCWEYFRLWKSICKIILAFLLLYPKTATGNTVPWPVIEP